MIKALVRGQRLALDTWTCAVVQYTSVFCSQRRARMISHGIGCESGAVVLGIEGGKVGSCLEV